jgi:hypothetical protein
MKNPIPRMRMLDGFNEGWIDFAGAAVNTIKGSIDVDELIGAAVATVANRSRNQPSDMLAPLRTADFNQEVRQ